MNDLKKSIGEAEATSAKIDEQLKEMEDEMAKLPPGDKSSSSGGAVPGICSLQ